MAFAPPPTNRTPKWLIILIIESLLSVGVGMSMIFAPERVFSIIHPPELSR